jgi:hypothetical protein
VIHPANPSKFLFFGRDLEQLEQLEQFCLNFFYMSRQHSKLCDSPFQLFQPFHFLLIWPRFGTAMSKLLPHEEGEDSKLCDSPSQLFHFRAGSLGCAPCPSIGGAKWAADL